jgi:hypothetical protein
VRNDSHSGFVYGRNQMRHASVTKSKNYDNQGDIDSRFDRRVHMFANSAYRNAKQRGFSTGHDVLKSVETDQEFIDSLNMPSYASIAKQGSR